MNVHGFAEMVKELAESVKVPIGLHLTTVMIMILLLLLSKRV